MAKIILFNKPFNVLSQFKKLDDKVSLADYLGKQIEVNAADCYPAGRLDYDSEGLLLLTNSGELQHLISHPSQKLEKTYWVEVEGSPGQADINKLKKDLVLKDGLCAPAKARIIKKPDVWERTPPVRHRAKIPTTWLEIKITEGRNRQVRRMTAAIGYPTLRLIRYAIGAWNLGSLQSGEYQFQEVNLPKNEAKKSPQKSGLYKTSR